MDMDYDLGGHVVWPRLEPDTDPAPSVLWPTVAPRRHSVGEREERVRVTAAWSELLGQLRKLVVEHGLQPLPTDVPLGAAIERITHRHVVRRDRLCHGAGSAPDLEEPARHFLAASGFGEDPIRHRIEVERESPVACAQSRLVRHWSPPRSPNDSGFETLVEEGARVTLHPHQGARNLEPKRSISRRRRRS